MSFGDAVTLGYVASNPLTGWKWEKVPTHEMRILGDNEEAKLLDSCSKLYGDQMRLFARFTLTTWGRLSEVTRLAWEDVRFDDECVYFRSTRSHEDRFIPIAPMDGLLNDLRRLQAKTMRDGGPFVAYLDKSNTNKRWHKIVDDADIPPITIHDLRRTGITRALLANMPPVTVQKLAGHKDLATTMRYYSKVTEQDLRDAVAKLSRTKAG